MLALLLLLLAPPAVKAVRPSIVQVFRPHGGGGCLAAPISSDLLLTAAHCVKDSQTLSWRGATSQGTAEVLWRKEEQDLAMLRAEGAAFLGLRLAKDLPEETASVWAFVYVQPDDSFDLVEGRAMRLHKTANSPKGVLFVDMLISPGTSGGVLLNEKGEVIGLLTSGWHPLPEHPVGHIFFRPIACATLLTKGSLK